MSEDKSIPNGLRRRSLGRQVAGRLKSQQQATVVLQREVQPGYQSFLTTPLVWSSAPQNPATGVEANPSGHPGLATGQPPTQAAPPSEQNIPREPTPGLLPRLREVLAASFGASNSPKPAQPKPVQRRASLRGTVIEISAGSPVTPDPPAPDIEAPPVDLESVPLTAAPPEEQPHSDSAQLTSEDSSTIAPTDEPISVQPSPLEPATNQPLSSPKKIPGLSQPLQRVQDQVKPLSKSTTLSPTPGQDTRDHIGAPASPPSGKQIDEAPEASMSAPVQLSPTTHIEPSLDREGPIENGGRSSRSEPAPTPATSSPVQRSVTEGHQAAVSAELPRETEGLEGVPSVSEPSQTPNHSPVTEQPSGEIAPISVPKLAVEASSPTIEPVSSIQKKFEPGRANVPESAGQPASPDSVPEPPAAAEISPDLNLPQTPGPDVAPPVVMRKHDKPKPNPAVKQPLTSSSQQEEKVTKSYPAVDQKPIQGHTPEPELFSIQMPQPISDETITEALRFEDTLGSVLAPTDQAEASATVQTSVQLGEPGTVTQAGSVRSKSAEAGRVQQSSDEVTAAEESDPPPTATVRQADPAETEEVFPKDFERITIPAVQPQSLMRSAVDGEAAAKPVFDESNSEINLISAPHLGPATPDPLAAPAVINKTEGAGARPISLVSFPTADETVTHAPGLEDTPVSALAPTGQAEASATVQTTLQPAEPVAATQAGSVGSNSAEPGQVQQSSTKVTPAAEPILSPAATVRQADSVEAGEPVLKELESTITPALPQPSRRATAATATSDNPNDLELPANLTQITDPFPVMAKPAESVSEPSLKEAPRGFQSTSKQNVTQSGSVTPQPPSGSQVDPELIRPRLDEVFAQQRTIEVMAPESIQRRSQDEAATSTPDPTMETPSASGSMSPPQTGAGATSEQANVETMARQVYQILRHRLRVEKERYRG